MGSATSKDEFDDVKFNPKASTKKGQKMTMENVDTDRSVDDSRIGGLGGKGDADAADARDPAAQPTGVTKGTAERSGTEEGSGRTGSTAASSGAFGAGAGLADESTSRGGLGSHVADDDIQVNLAMADLMAYLQVVANNSSNLPLTRRDDPELGRTVSTLTADEYAKKSAAFIPSDVRIIGGSFARYGKVWDLPTSEEFAPADGSQEPGRSHGGACCNSLLKVLYDAEGIVADVTENSFMNADNLFDEDESTIVSQPSCVSNQAKSFESLVLGDVTTPATITWASLLRQMKGEMQDVGYAQVPALTSTRKFDLNKPFSLVPPNFDPAKNKKRSLLIGCNYGNSAGAELKASHDDVRSMKDFIVNVHGFPESKGMMTVLLDDDAHKHPTHMNIIEAFKELSEQSLPGDAVFVQFSGHGGRILDSPIDSEVESYDEAIIPSDFNGGGLIRDTLFFKTLLAPMRYGVMVTCIFDSSDTGVMMDLPYSWSTKNDRPDTLPKMSLNDDFSFVRFLKVIKTLYERSTFTQLGKTVGTALTDKGPVDTALDAEDDEGALVDDDTLGVGSLVTVDDEEEKAPAKANSLMDMFAACHSPPESSSRKIKSNTSGLSDNRSKITGKMGDNETDDSRTPKGSLLQQVMNCTFTHPEEDSDEDTFHAATMDDDNTYDGDHTYDGGQTVDTDDDQTYDSFTDDGNMMNARESARLERRRNRR